jgi:NADP-dependent 3-hydroxy acid dehydrogenase YdfG
MPREAPRTVLRGNATYALVGGMGGIGRALAVRLVESGARHLVFLSRSGATKPAAIDLIKLLQQAGATTMVLKCDIGDVRQLEKAFQEITQRLPPVKGMFHLGMVMRSALFDNMSLNDWTDSLLPKVQGTWNLHNILPKDLDFFVLISSFVGIVGNASQAAYSAASSFQDAFSAYRNHLGLPAITIDLGLVTEIGYVADRDILESKLRAQGHDDIPADECLAIIEEAISQPFQSEHEGNLITGFGLGRFTGGDIHHASHQSPQSSHARRLALSAFSGRTLKKESGATLRVRELLRNATSVAAAEDQVTEAVRIKLSTLLMLSLDDIESFRPLSYYGLDSLVAVVSKKFPSRSTSSSLILF